MIDAMHGAASGITEGFSRLSRTAHEIARDPSSESLGTQMVDLRRARHQVAANAAALRTADETIGTLLDVLA